MKMKYKDSSIRTILVLRSVPGVLIHLDGHQCVLHGLVDQRVDAGYKEVNGAEQGLAVLTQQLLSLCVVAKLILCGQRETLTHKPEHER